jgi:phosphatidylinositol alpha-1,6-mannosyltransferase
MRILCCSPDYKPSIGGIAEFTHRTSLAMHTLGHDVFVAAPDAEGARQFDAVAGGLPTFRIGGGIVPLSQFSYLNIARKLPTFFATRRAIMDLENWMARFVEKHGIDVVLCFHWDIFGAAARRLRAQVGTPYYVVCYGMEILPSGASLAGRMQHDILRAAAATIPISHYTRRRVLKAAGEGLNTIVSFCGVDAVRFQRIGQADEFISRHRHDGRRIVLTLGRLVERKGIDRSLDAFRICVDTLRDPSIEYWIAGDGPERERLQAQAAQLGVGDRVRFLGAVSDEEKTRLYSVAEVFVTTSRELSDGDAEGFGIVFLEANACELPVVAGRSGGIEDAVQHGVTGLLVDPNSPADIAAAMVTLLSDPARAQAMGRAGRARAMTEFSWEQVASRILQGLRNQGTR